jgi:hypothetical protein
MSNTQFTFAITADASTLGALMGAIVTSHSHAMNMLDDKSRHEMFASLDKKTRDYLARMPPERRKSLEIERDALNRIANELDRFMEANGISTD